MKKIFIPFLFLSIIFFSCKKDSNINPIPTGGGNTIDTVGTIYAAGYRFSASTSKSIATYWRGRTEVSLTDGTKEAYATGITLVGTDVYICGYEITTAAKAIAKYWKNGIVTNLTDGTKSAEASAISVVGTDIYVAGYELNTAGKTVAKYWKNGTAINLSDGSFDAITKGLFVSGSDVYVTGYESNAAGKSVAKYWKNSTSVNLTGDFSIFTTSSIAVNGNDVYVTGTNFTPLGFNQAYWKNGLLSNLDASSIAEINSVKVNQGNVYVGGNDAGKAVYWKNGVKNSLQNNASAVEHVNSIFAFAGKVYCGGYRDLFGSGEFVATVWSSGTSTDLNTATKSKVNSIYVVN